MRIVAVSDTHYRHRQIVVPNGDLLVHAGDLTRSGHPDELAEVMHWFSRLPHPHKVCICGNHDWVFQLEPAVAAKLIPSNVTYLEDSGCVIEGVRFWGSPVQPEFLNWAFNRSRGREIDRHWQMIPAGTDVVVTHGPCHGILDCVQTGEHVGCEMLRRRLETIQPKLHLCGHIHAGYGTSKLGPTTMVNAAVCTERYEPINRPIVIDLTGGVAVIDSPAPSLFPAP